MILFDSLNTMPRASKPKTKKTASKKSSKFTLTGEHKTFLAKRADEHAEASQQEKLKVVALAIQELLAEYSITSKEDVKKADKVFLSRSHGGLYMMICMSLC